LWRVRRSDALAPLSRDHHQGLFVAQRLNRATPETAAAARAASLRFFEEAELAHFRIEEEVLLPALARHHRQRDDAVARVTTDHIELRRRAAELAADPDPPLDALRSLGETLAAHIRHEERVLFPLIEGVLPEDELAALGAAVAQRTR
jgi:iron-sulfur cluster repair protein YtfE (RIC family)